MKPNDLITDPDGRPARLITMPIPGREPKRAVVLYADGRGRLVDLAQCRPVGDEATRESTDEA
ncbi:MAG: hypothetical protein KC410_19885 [Anaerolineales bacterium]|uniref:hypothetical protein n=1 Tax=Promineifilum sp. TaxID=2664178 RepID=UPI001DE0FF2C|nr:hypothetical protein [Anaerolineales bacterium]MCO5181150.1 hypothetical protein [Promineifilum sp.]